MGISAKIPNSMRKEVYKRDGYACVLCSDNRRLQIHHYEPRSAGGVDHPMNLVTVCPQCHQLLHGQIKIADWLTQEDAKQALAEYLGDYYNKDNEGNPDTLWYPWDA